MAWLLAFLNGKAPPQGVSLLPSGSYLSLKRTAQLFEAGRYGSDILHSGIIQAIEAFFGITDNGRK